MNHGQLSWQMPKDPCFGMHPGNLCTCFVPMPSVMASHLRKADALQNRILPETQEYAGHYEQPIGFI